MKRWWLLAVAALVAVPAAGGARPAEHRFFVTPGANGVSCELDTRVAGHGRFASCAIRGGRPASAFLHATGVAGICRGADCNTDAQNRTAVTLQVDESIQVGPFKCTARSNGVVCVVRQYMRGFFIGPGGVRRQEPTGYYDSKPVWSPDGRTIAFNRYRRGRVPWKVVAAINRDGSDLHRLIPSAARDASWSPDGQTIAYLDTSSNGRARLRLLTHDGSGQRRVRTVGPASDFSDSPSSPVWSGDGRTVAVRVAGFIYVADADSRRFRRLKRADAFAWSPNRRQIAIREASPCGICVMDVARGELSSLFPDEGLRGSIAWSPDGSMVAFSSERDGTLLPEGVRTSELYVAKVDGTDVRRLTHYSDVIAHDSDPIWSPDGRTILYEHHSDYYPLDPNGGCGVIVCTLGGAGAGYRTVELYAMNDDGSNQRRFTPDRLEDVAWSPDGRTIAFTKGQRIWLADGDGSNQRRLT